MRQIVSIALEVAGRRRPILPAPASLLRLGAHVIQHLPGRVLTPDGVDFVNQPATVDVGPLLAAMPRRLTPLREGLGTYLRRERESAAWTRERAWARAAVGRWPGVLGRA